MTTNYIPMPLAAEHLVPERTGDPTSEWTNQASNGPVTIGHQPEGDNNPEGDQPGIAAFAINQEVAARLEGPQPS